MRWVAKVVHGSHLYGTANEDSDWDYKGIYLPPLRDLILYRHLRSIREIDEEKGTDLEVYNLQFFIKLACEGQTIPIDMLHAPSDCVLISSSIWDEMVENRHRFYTRSMKSYVKYARKQAAVYGIKGSRLADLRSVVGVLGDIDPNERLYHIWDLLPEGEHIHFLDGSDGLCHYQVCGRSFQETVKVGYVLPILRKLKDEYGARAEKAEMGEGVDWKAVSHAVRAAYQIIEILEKKNNTIPLVEKDFIRHIKEGRVLYSAVSDILDILMYKIEELSLESDLPEEVDTEYWDDFVLRIYGVN